MPTLASVIVFKIQEFSRRPVVDQTRLKAQLEGLIALVIQPLPAADRVVLDMTDGVAVVMLGNPIGALELAERSQAAAADLPLCIGINQGPVTAVADTLRGTVLVGDGLAAGMTVASAATPGRFLVSRPFREVLHEHSPARAHDLGASGVLTDSNVRTHELFAIDHTAAPARRRRFAVAGVLAVTGIIGMGFAARAVVQYLAIVPPAVINFDIRPRGEVIVDGVLKGNTPPLKSLEIKPGMHSIEVRNGAFPPLRVDLNLASAEETTITHTFERPKSVVRSKGVREEKGAEPTLADRIRDLRRQMGF